MTTIKLTELEALVQELRAKADRAEDILVGRLSVYDPQAQAEEVLLREGIAERREFARRIESCLVPSATQDWDEARKLAQGLREGDNVAVETAGGETEPAVCRNGRLLVGMDLGSEQVVPGPGYVRLILCEPFRYTFPRQLNIGDVVAVLAGGIPVTFVGRTADDRCNRYTAEGRVFASVLQAAIALTPRKPDEGR